MKRLFTLGLLALISLSASAHHSFAIFDFDTKIPFEGTVETLNFRNPHIAMTLKTTDENGEEVIINFIEGAPANMIVRGGLKPDRLAPGTKLTAIGSPLIEDPEKFFLREVQFENGEVYSW